MLKLLHLSWEMPDSFNERKTKAVENLIKETKRKFQTYTLSFNRSSKNIFSSLPCSTKSYTSIRYFGLSYGLLHLSSLKYLYRQVHAEFQEFDLLHGHKITFEGVLCYFAYKKLGKRYVLTLRGDTDFKFIRCLPQYRGLFRKVVEYAEKIFCLNPWSADKLKELYPSASTKIVILPNICYVEKFLKSQNRITTNSKGKIHIVTTFYLDVYKRKRFEFMLRVLSRLSLPASLLVIGAGSPEAEASVRKLIRRYSVQGKVQLLGFKNHEDMINIYQECDMFLLPSKRETFGMVYLEALSCGLPVFQAAGVGLDGYFVNEPFYLTAESEEEFVTAIEEFFPKKQEVKNHLMNYMKNGNFEKFSVKNIVNTYVSEIYSVFEN